MNISTKWNQIGRMWMFICPKVWVVGSDGWYIWDCFWHEYRTLFWCRRRASLWLLSLHWGPQWRAVGGWRQGERWDIQLTDECFLRARTCEQIVVELLRTHSYVGSGFISLFNWWNDAKYLLWLCSGLWRAPLMWMLWLEPMPLPKEVVKMKVLMTQLWKLWTLLTPSDCR